MLRRLPLSIPLAVVVALTAHTAEFGFSHAFGGALGFRLIAASVSALAFAAILTPPMIGVYARRISRASFRHFAVRLGCEIAGGGAATYIGMERLEGHDPSFAWWRMLALVSAASLTLLATMLGVCGLTRVGYALAEGVREIADRFPLVFRLALGTFRTSVVRFLRDVGQGRAPPLRA